VRDLAAGPRRFVELQRVLPGISTEQLRSRLNRMVADGMLTRKRYREVPPRVDYELTERARDLMPVLAELAHWGYQWAWSAPRSSERVDLGAIFRLMPGLIEAAGAQGEVELTVGGGSRDGGEAKFTVSLHGDHAEVCEAPAKSAETRIRGNVQAWVRAFSPEADRSALSVEGDHALADTVLGALTIRAASASDRSRSAA
jgi:DNA-binding HxlR family transcriptional regulator